jgi:hypothetical protein
MTQRVEAKIGAAVPDAPVRKLDAGAAGLTALVRHVFAGGLAGTLAGIVCLGLGSRLAMRIAALLDPSARGALTENDNIVGEVTLRGTLELVVFVGIFGGLIAGLLWVLVREWLPRRGLARVAAAGVVAALLGSFQVVSGENRDFALLDPAAASVAMFVVVVGLAGCGAAVIDGPLERLLPGGTRASVVIGALLVIGGVMSVPLVAQAFLSADFCGCEGPPRPALAFLALAGLATAGRWARYFNPGADLPHRTWLRALGVAGVAGACLVAALDLLGEVREIV